jgi:hypothetical protein
VSKKVRDVIDEFVSPPLWKKSTHANKPKSHMIMLPLDRKQTKTGLSFGWRIKNRGNQRSIPVADQLITDSGKGAEGIDGEGTRKRGGISGRRKEAPYVFG